MRRILYIMTLALMAGSSHAGNVIFKAKVWFNAGDDGARCYFKISSPDLSSAGPFYVECPSGWQGGAIEAALTQYWLGAGQSLTKHVNWVQIYGLNGDQVEVAGLVSDDGNGILTELDAGFVNGFDYYVNDATMNPAAIIEFEVFVNGASPPTYIVRYQVVNETAGPVAIAIMTDDIEHLSTHIEPITETEVQATEIHPWIYQGSEIFTHASVRVYQDGQIMAESSPIDFVQDGAMNWVSELHAVRAETPPEPKLHLSCTAMNGMSAGLTATAEINTSSGFYNLSLGTVGAGSYYSPSVQTFTQILDLDIDETPVSVVFKLWDGTQIVATQNIPISTPTDGYDYYASGVVNVSGIPDVENPNPNPDPGTDPDPDDPYPNPDPPDKPPAPQPADPDDPNPNPIDYEKMAQAMEFALNNQKVSGVNDSVQNLTDVVKGMDTGATDLSGVEAGLDEISGKLDGSYQTYPAPVAQDEYAGDLTNALTVISDMNTGPVGNFVDAVEAKIRSMFTLELPNIGTVPVYAQELPGFMGLELPPLAIDLEEYPMVPQVRNVLLFCLYLWAFFAALKIVQGAIAK